MKDENIILNGDCLEIMPLMPSGKISLILCDLPYGTTACKWDTIIPLDKLWEQYERLIKPNGTIVLTASQPFTSALVMSNPSLFKYSYVWIKSTSTNFLNSKKQPLRRKEDILVFYKRTPTYNPQGLIRQTINNSRPFKSKKGEHINGKEKEIGLSEFVNYPTDVLEIKNSNHKSLHPTQKPLELMDFLIKTHSNEGDLILDNCMGVGTTCISAKQNNRTWIGIEKEKKYFEIASKRLNETLL